MAYSKSTQTKQARDRKALVSQLDKIIRVILPKLEDKCCCCGKTEGLQVGHYITRSVYALRWDLQNCHLQCGGCNLRHNYDPSPYTQFMLDTFGTDVFKDLVFKRKNVSKVTTVQMRELLQVLERSSNEIR